MEFKDFQPEKFEGELFPILRAMVARIQEGEPLTVEEKAKLFDVMVAMKRIQRACRLIQEVRVQEAAEFIREVRDL